MRLVKYPRIRFGRDDYKKLSVHERKDIIYKVFLGDRQIWKKNADEEEEFDSTIELDYSLRMVWHVYDYLILGNVTSATSITGTIDWGDGTIENWKSGNVYNHRYSEEGDYSVTLNCQKFFPMATIGQITPYYSASTDLGKIPYLKSVSFCKIPYLSTRLIEDFYHETDIPEKRMFEDYTKLEQIIIPVGITSILDKMFYNTGIEEVILPATLESIGAGAFVRTETNYNPLIIRISKTDKNKTLTVAQLINSQLGYKIKEIDSGLEKISNITVYCPEDFTDIINYFESFGATVKVI